MNKIRTMRNKTNKSLLNRIIWRMLKQKRIRHKQKRLTLYKRYSKLGKLDLVSVIPLILVIFILFQISSFFSNAQEKSIDADVYVKQYKSILIQEGDTLWKIAKVCVDQRGEKFSEIQICINEIKKINGLPDNKIFSGKHIIVPIYVRNKQYIE